MPSTTLSADARALPNRRRALASLAAAGGFLLAPRAAKADGDDVALFRQVERVDGLHAAQQAHTSDETEEGELAFNRAVRATAVAQAALMEMQPRTFAGLRAMAAALLASDAFGLEGMAADLAQTIVDMPALDEVSR